jgi:hypothetical protein
MQMPRVWWCCLRSVRLGDRGRAGWRSVEATCPGSLRMLGAPIARGRAGASAWLAVEASAGRSFLSVGVPLVDTVFMELSEKGAR